MTTYQRLDTRRMLRATRALEPQERSEPSSEQLSPKKPLARHGPPLHHLFPSRFHFQRPLHQLLPRTIAPSQRLLTYVALAEPPLPLHPASPLLRLRQHTPAGY